MEIDQSKLQARIVSRIAPVTGWAEARVLIDPKSGPGVISDFYSDYTAFCRIQKLPVLPRKGWLQTLKLAGFAMASGGFAGLRLK
jgi:hypothetical protein